MAAAREALTRRRASVYLVPLAAVLFALAVALVATTASAGRAAGPRVLIGWSDPLGSEEGLRAVGYGESQAIKKLGLQGWTVKDLDAKLSADKQVSDIDTFI